MTKGDIRLEKLVATISQLDPELSSKLYEQLSHHYEQEAEVNVQRRKDKELAMDYFKISADMHDLSEKFKDIYRILNQGKKPKI